MQVIELPPIDDELEVLLSKCSAPERVFFLEVLEKTLGSSARRNIRPQLEFEESSGRKRYIDFALTTAQSRFAIELDGFTYHAEGAVTPQKHSDDLARQNELILGGWTPLRFSWHQVQTAVEGCRDQLRRAVRADPELHPNMASTGLVPHAVQVEALTRLAEARAKGLSRGLIVLPTGLGKTYLAAFDAKAVGGRVLFIVHNNTILEQTRLAFGRVFPDATLGLFNSYEKRPDAHIVLANIATLRNSTNRIRFSRDEFAYVIVDEFHHGATDSYRDVVDYFKPKFFLGLTATPNRTDGKPILDILGNNLIYSLTQREAIERGFLVPFRYFGLRDNVDYTNIRHNGYRYDIRDLDRLLVIEKRDDAIVAKYRDLAEGKKAIGFCVSISHAERAAAHFSSHGVAALAIHCNLSKQERDRRVAAFRGGTCRVVFVRDIFNEGVDFPDVEALMFLRPTESRVVFIQQLGRGLRLSPRKDDVVVLDFIGNYVNAGRVTDYLADGGAPGVDLGTLREKPVHYFDYGCEVHFEPEVVDLLCTVGTCFARDDELMAELSQLYLKARRCPRFVDVCRGSRFSVGQYVGRYGSWEKAVARFAQLNEGLDTTPLALPRLLHGMSLEEYVDAIDLNAEAFYATVATCSTAVRQAFVSFETFAKVPRSTTRLKHALREFRDAVRAAAGAMMEVLTVLALRLVDNREALPARAPDLMDAATQLGEGAAARLASVLNDTLAYSMPRSFARIQPQIEALEALASSRSAQEEGKMLEALYANLSALERRFDDAHQVTEKALCAMEED